MRGNRFDWLRAVIASEAKQSISPSKERMDCFVARAPRNDVDGAAPLTAVVPRECGGSSTQRLLGSSIDVSGILDRPPSRTMTAEYVAAFSRRDAPELCK